MKHIAMPATSRKYHIFDSKGYSSCKKWFFECDNNNSQPFTGKETFNPDTDCKACFKKEGLVTK